MNAFNRRKFLKRAGVSAAGVAVASNLNASGTKFANAIPAKIITRKLGNTGIEMPVISLGCGKVDSPSIIKGAYKAGIRHFDTAYRYQLGNSEKLLGEVLKEYPRESFTIATKIVKQDTKENFLKMFEESLERLQMDYVDILYLHGGSKREQMLNPDVLAALKEAKDSGKAKHIGVSTHKNEPDVIQAAIDSNFYEVVLAAYNFKQNHNKEIAEKMALGAQKGLGFIGMKVMAGGFLDKEKTKAVDHVAALKWNLRNENIATTVPSIVNFDQLKKNSGVLYDTKLTPEEENNLVAAINTAGLFCNGCEACVASCAKSLPIPELMRAYMYNYGYGDAKKAKELIADIGVNENPCADCSSCTVSCTKKFNVAEKIKDISRLSNIPDEFLA